MRKRTPFEAFRISYRHRAPGCIWQALAASAYVLALPIGKRPSWVWRLYLWLDRQARDAEKSAFNRRLKNWRKAAAVQLKQRAKSAKGSACA